jgi:hypothetical protein
MAEGVETDGPASAVTGSSSASAATAAPPGGPALEEAASWAGHKLDEIGGAAVGRVEGVYIDAERGAPEWLMARLGRFGRHCLVPARDAVAGVGHVWVPYTRDQIRRGPRIEPNQSLERDQEATLLAYYGIGDTAGRAAEIAERPADAVTARPVV